MAQAHIKLTMLWATYASSCAGLRKEYADRVPRECESLHQYHCDMEFYIHQERLVVLDQGVKDDEEILKALIDIKVHKLREHLKKTVLEVSASVGRGMLIYRI